MATGEYTVTDAEKDMPNSDPDDPHNDKRKYTWSDVQSYGEIYASRKLSEWAYEIGLAQMRREAEESSQLAAKADEEYKRFCQSLRKDVDVLEDIAMNIPPVPETDAQMEALIKPIESE